MPAFRFMVLAVLIVLSLVLPGRVFAQLQDETAQPGSAALSSAAPGLNTNTAPSPEQLALQLRIRDLRRDIVRLDAAMARANRRKPLILLGIGTALTITGGALMAAAPSETGVVPGVIVAGAGFGVLLSSAISGLVRRGKRHHYAGQIERRAFEIERLEDRLSLSFQVAPGVRSASLTLRF